MTTASAISAPAFRYRTFQRPFDLRWRFVTGFSSPPRRILDVGCGPGWNLAHFAEHYPGLELYGVDLLEHAPETITYRRVNLDHEPLPFPSSHFDIVMMTHVIEHLHHPTAIAREIGRVLAPGGWCYIEAPNWRATARPWACFWDDPTHVRPWSNNGFHSLLTEYIGVRIEAIGTRRNWPAVPRDLAKIATAAITGKWNDGAGARWNVLGWATFAIGQKLTEAEGER